MCFGSSGSPKVSIPAPQPLPPAPAPPPAPKQPAPAPRPLQVQSGETGVRPKTSERQRLGIRRGTSQMRIPLNVGSQSSGGLNV
jgi:hypothetical protein